MANRRKHADHMDNSRRRPLGEVLILEGVRLFSFIFLGKGTYSVLVQIRFGHSFRTFISTSFGSCYGRMVEVKRNIDTKALCVSDFE